MLTLFGGAVALSGYTLGLWGWCQLRGPGVGFADLVVPSRAQGFATKLAAAIQATANPQNLAPGSTPGTGPSGQQVSVIPPPAPSNVAVDPNTGRVTGSGPENMNGHNPPTDPTGLGAYLAGLQGSGR